MLSSLGSFRGRAAIKSIYKPVSDDRPPFSVGAQSAVGTGTPKFPFVTMPASNRSWSPTCPSAFSNSPRP